MSVTAHAPRLKLWETCKTRSPPTTADRALSGLLAASGMLATSAIKYLAAGAGEALMAGFRQDARPLTGPSRELSLLIYKIEPAPCEMLLHRGGADLDRFLAIAGTALADQWEPIAVKFYRRDDHTRERLPYADFPFLESRVLVMRDRAIGIASPLLAPYGEFLPLKARKAELSLFHSTWVIDALDEERSEIVRFDDGRIMIIESYAFRSGVLPERAAFLLPQERDTIYYTEALVQELDALGLTGIAWSAVGEAQPRGAAAS